MREDFDQAWPYIISSMLVIICLAYYKLKISAKREKFKLPPGRRGWPIIGDSISWYNAVASSHPPRYVEQQVEKYGKIFSCSLFGKWAVVSADPVFNRFVMQNEGKLFQSSYPKSFRDLVGKNGVITAQGDQQRKLHTISSNMMRIDKLKFHFLQEIQIVMKKIINSFQDTQAVCLQDVCRKIAINLMVNQLLGISSESEVNEIASLFSDFVDGCISVPIKLPGFAYHEAMKARECIISKINKIMDSQRRGASLGTDNGLLGRLLEEEHLPDDTVADFIINLLFAGNETTAKTMVFAVYFLTRCPVALKQIQDEHQRIMSGKDGEILTWEDYKAMTFTQCVIDETLRLGGIAIWLMREAKEDIKYEDFMIPRGCFVVPFLSAIHLNGTVYEDSLIFNPWRWMNPENQDKRNWRTSSYFAPFGGGTRFCPGAELARLQIALFLHFFLTSFRWKQLKEDQMSFFPSARLVNGFQIQLTKLSHGPKM